MLALSCANACATPRSILRDMERAVEAEPAKDEAGLRRLTLGLQPELNKMSIAPGRYIRPLLEIVTDPTRDWRLRNLATIPLGHSKSQSLVAPLVKIVLDISDHPEVRAGAARGLGNAAIQSKQARQALERVVAEPDTPKPLILAAMQTLGYAGSDDLELMRKVALQPPDNHLGTSFNGLRAIVASDNPGAMAVALELLEKYGANTLHRGVILDDLLSMSLYAPGTFEPLIPKLFPLLLEFSKVEQFGQGNLNTVVQLLGQTRDRRAVDRLIELLDHPDPVMAWRAAEALGKIGDRRALPHVERLWNGIPNDPRADFQLRRMYASWKKNPQINQIIPGIEQALEQLRKSGE